MAEDYYKTLGVSRTATQAEIQKAYRDMARKYHPDLHPDDKDAKRRFQEVQGAFDVLNDPQKRELYDRYGSSFEQMAGAGAGPSPGARGSRGGTSWSFTGSPEDIDFANLFGERFGEGGGGFADLFGQFRGGGGGGRAAAPGRRGGRPKQGEDLAYEIGIPFATAVTGGEAQLSLRRSNGNTETLAVKIPAGIDEGQQIRLRGQGEPRGRSGERGDLLITIRVEAHPFFQRRENNLHVKVPVTLAEAALGAKIEIPSPRGQLSLAIPPGTSSGMKLRVRGQGVIRAGKPPGDLLAEVQIIIPKALDPKEQEQIRQIDAAHPTDPRRDLRW